MTRDRVGALIRIQAALSLVVAEFEELPDAPEEVTATLLDVLDWAKSEVALALGESQGWPRAH